MRVVYFLGTAGSGKSTLVGAFAEWCRFNGFRVSTMNLDPGADEMPYSPDIDIRDWISLDGVMREYGLGPNGAQVVAADLMAMNFGPIAEVVDGFRSDDMLLVDTPGQIELFAFRQSTNVIIESLGADDSFLVFLADPTLSRTPSGFVSNLMLYGLCQFRFPIPAVNMLSKADLVTEEDMARMTEWSRDPYALYSELLDSSMSPQTVLSIELFKAMENIGMYEAVNPVSAQAGEGMEDIYNAIMQTYEGGEDIVSQ